jgi:hypothetical protein
MSMEQSAAEEGLRSSSCNSFYRGVTIDNEEATTEHLPRASHHEGPAHATQTAQGDQSGFSRRSQPVEVLPSLSLSKRNVL